MICLCGHPYLSHESGECTEKGCPCVKWEEVAEGPDGFFGVQEWSGGTELGLFDFPVYAPQGGGPVADPFKDITARQTNTIADLSKKEWKP